MGNKYMVLYKNYDDIAWHNYGTKNIIKALIRFIKVLGKYEMVDFGKRK